MVYTFRKSYELSGSMSGVMGDKISRHRVCILIKAITHLDYQELRQISPEAARRAILQVLKAHKGNVTAAARILSVSRATIYKAIRKNEGWGFERRFKSAAPGSQQTSAEIEARILELRDKTRYGPVRLKEELEELDGLMISEYTIRNILRRNKAKLKPKPHKPHKRAPVLMWIGIRPKPLKSSKL